MGTDMRDERYDVTETEHYNVARAGQDGYLRGLEVGKLQGITAAAATVKQCLHFYGLEAGTDRDRAAGPAERAVCADILSRLRTLEEVTKGATRGTSEEEDG